MAQAMAETVSYVNRARSFMPTGTVPPFIMRFDAGSVPVGYLVFSTDNPNITIGQIQDAALFRGTHYRSRAFARACRFLARNPDTRGCAVSGSGGPQASL